ncbi:hypothetical protein JD844_028409 [Phrynosoma platyrhinos]|uniref:Fibronectin type-III domain-containing protein n=1 Tax=Phrynosoma platyrhinos TaxID=52577 RepID=A0ABQ7SHU4_PHRPL|nr:hypothetical protein JD844_028409 [Phrynosoma platyrhinos]
MTKLNSTTFVHAQMLTAATLYFSEGNEDVSFAMLVHVDNSPGENKDKKNMRSYSIVLALSLISSVTETRESPLMQTLNCSTDYKSCTACTWFEPQEARSLVNMTLFHKDNYQNLTNMTCNSQKVGSLIRWECHRKQIYFNIKLKNVFVFKPQLSLEAQLNVSIFNNVQPLPPQKLVVSVTENGDSLLIWEPGGETNRSHWLDSALDFEVSYKRFWEPWEEASSLMVSNASHCLLRHDKLVSGNTYVARVRSKPGRESQLAGQYSDWSSVVTWDTPEDEVEAQPKNLRCQFNSIDWLKCSWEVRQEVTSSVFFALFYKDNPTSQEEECSPVHEKELPYSPLNSPHHVLQSCEISVTNPNGQSQYLVTVRPKEEKREVNATMQIKTAPPYDLSVTVLNDYIYRLQWKDRVPLNFKQMYQISYWKTGNPLEKVELQDDLEDRSSQSSLESQVIGYTKILDSAVEKKVISSHQTQIFDYDGPYLHCPPESSLSDISQDVQAAPSEKMGMSVCLKHMGLSHCLSPQQLPTGKEKGAVPLFPAISDQCKEEKQQLLKKQEGSQRDKSGKKENRLQHLPDTNCPGQNGALDYIATENLSISKEKGSLLWVPVVAPEKRIPACIAMTAGVPETTADLSSSRMGQKKPEIMMSSQGQIPTVPSVKSQEAFDEYVISLSVTPGSVLKEELAFSPEEPKHNKGFLIFSPDNKSPVFLSQVGEYCFFPGFRPSKESPKNPVGTAENNFSQTDSKVTKPLGDSKPDGSIPRLEV